MEITIGNRLEEIAKVARTVERFARRHRLPASVVHAVGVSLDELISNVIAYGYRDRRRHRITVRLSLAAPDLVVLVEDDGVLFDPLAQPPPEVAGSLHERRQGGLGIAFVRALMDEVRYRRVGERNQVEMRKRVSSPAEPS